MGSMVDMPHRNIPIFIPHLGCPNQCVFCNQRSISGHGSFREETVAEEIEAALRTLSPDANAEIAFFGGSFTGIDRALMLRLLETAERYVREGCVSGIRLSTRPDYVTPEILEILSRYSVRTVELGLQSMDESVLLASKRGHTAKQAAEACRAVVNAGFSLVGQMMIGLPQATLESELRTAEEICELGASAARIYPTVVFYETPLCEMVRDGSYKPLSLEEAVMRTAAVLDVFSARGVPCIRIGLCATEALLSADAVMAGPNHPALGELVLGEQAYGRLLCAVRDAKLCGKPIVLEIPAREISRTVGQHRRNLVRLEQETGTTVKKIIGNDHIEKVLPRLWQPNGKSLNEQ